MNNKQLEQHLQQDLPDFEVSTHKEALRNYLISSYQPHIQEKKNVWRGGEYMMKHKLITLGLTGFAVVALLVGWTMFGENRFSPLPPAQAEAKEIINRTFDKVVKLSAEEQKKLQQQFKDDIEGSLEEAKNAKDLTVVPESELQRMSTPQGVSSDETKPVYGFSVAVDQKMEGGKNVGYGPETASGERPARVPGEVRTGKTAGHTVGYGSATGTATAVVPDEVKTGKIMVPEGLTILRYTDPLGAKVLLGIDKDDKPVFKMMRLDQKDIEKMEKEGPHMIKFEGK